MRVRKFIGVFIIFWNISNVRKLTVARGKMSDFVGSVISRSITRDVAFFVGNVCVLVMEDVIIVMGWYGVMR